MILSLLNDFLQFLLMVAGFILSVLGDLAPFIVAIMIGQMLGDDILAILGDKHERERIMGDKHEQDR